MTARLTEQSIIIPETKALTTGDVFAVYGSLRKGLGNYSNLQLDTRAEFLGEDTVKGSLFSLGGYPGLLKQALGLTPDEVAVELYRITNPDLGPRLDGLEGYRMDNPERSFYVRSEVTTVKGNTASIYYYNGGITADRYVPSGDWSEWVSKRFS